MAVCKTVHAHVGHHVCLCALILNGEVEQSAGNEGDGCNYTAEGGLAVYLTISRFTLKCKCQMDKSHTSLPFITFNWTKDICS